MEKTKNNQEFMNNWGTYQIGRKFMFAPTAVVEDPKLSSQAKILFLIINSFSQKFGYCFANNETLSEKIGLKKTMLKKYLNELQDNKIIGIKLLPTQNFKRTIHVNFEELKKRYPKLPVAIPASCKLSAKAAKILGRS